MSAAGFLFTSICGWLIFTMPRRWALLPLLVGTLYMTIGQAIEIGPASFTVIRLLVVVGVLRVIHRGERVAGGMCTLDKAMIWWAVVAVIVSVFHEKPASYLVSMLGLSYDCLGLFFLMRIFVRSMEDFARISKVLLLLLIPLAMEMTYEKITGHNLFSYFGYVAEEATVRGGRIRAQGPFAHSILSGSVGAMSMPLTILIWRESRKLAIVGLGVTGLMVLSSASSGPILAVMAMGGALFMWRYRAKLRIMLWGVVAMLVALHFYMNDPVWYLMAHIDLTGSSTGWHRAALINAAVTHLDEWWFAGTDFTRHWMPTGVYWTQDHADITNHYLKMGVWGGLPLMFVFVFIMGLAFSSVGKTLALYSDAPAEEQFSIWLLGVILFGHAITFMSVSYFDQSIVLFYLSLAVIGSVYSVTAARVTRHTQADEVVFNPPDNEAYTTRA